MVKRNRRQTLAELTSEFNTASGSSLSSRTVKRRIFAEGYKHKAVSKKITIGARNQTKRRSFCREKLHWTVDNNWSHIIFSEETKIVVETNRKVYVWRNDEEQLRPECLGVQPDSEHPARASTMFWDCICYHGVGTLTPVTGNKNADKYISILDYNVWPVVARHFVNKPWIFQEDNSPCHVSIRANAWKKDNGIVTLPWPAQSPYINIIENVWKILKCRDQKRVNEIKK